MYIIKELSRNKAKMVKHKLVSLATVVALWPLVSLLIKLIRMLLKWKYIQDKNCAIFAAMLRKRSYFVTEKVSSRVPGLKCSYGKIFIPVTEISVAKSEISVTGASPASHMITSKFLRRKEWRGEISETEPARLTGLI